MYMNNQKSSFLNYVISLCKASRCFALSLVTLLSYFGPAYAGSTCVYSLPECPAGTTARIYAPIQESYEWLEELPRLDKTIDVRDAKPYFESIGIKFPNGGYALYFGRSHTLIATPTSEGHDTLTFLLD